MGTVSPLCGPSVTVADFMECVSKLSVFRRPSATTSVGIRRVEGRYIHSPISARVCSFLSAKGLYACVALALKRKTHRPISLKLLACAF